MMPLVGYRKVVILGYSSVALQDEYTILPHSFIIGIHGYVLVYLVTLLRSFQVVKTLHNRLYESRGKTWMPVVLVGNKAHLSMDRWCRESSLRSSRRSIGWTTHMATSATASLCDSLALAPGVASSSEAVPWSGRGGGGCSPSLPGSFPGPCSPGRVESMVRSHPELPGLCPGGRACVCSSLDCGFQVVKGLIKDSFLGLLMSESFFH